MKIGILTYHRTLNYGACLQAVATRIVLEKMGHEVYYVDYWPEYHQGKYKVFSWNRFKNLRFLSKCKYLFNTLRYFRTRKIRNASFHSFLNTYILPYCRSIEDEYDAIVYGSDQIWRKQSELKAYNPIYFGKNELRTKKHIAYSASMGILPNNGADKEIVRKLVSHMDKIAVREKDLQALLFELGYKDVSLTLDPTLLLTASEWNKVVPTEPYTGPQYMLVYGIDKHFFNMQKIKAYADSRGCIVKVISGTATKKNTKNFITTAGVEGFLHLLRNAECIFTSSFHGLAFSIIYQKEFFASYPNNSNRAETLLDILGLKERLIKPQGDIPNMRPLDYTIATKNLCNRKKLSLDYLAQSLD